MKWLTRHGRAVCRAVGVLLLLAALLPAYWWFYRLASARRTLSYQWYARHSQREYWREVQKGIRRGTWLHDDGFTVGHYGDKSWAEWIINHVEPGMGMGCMGEGPCHSAASMRYITNQDAGEDADGWLAWWEKNKAKSQEEWIEDGFRRQGFEIDVPPTLDETPVLLELLGSPETDEPPEILEALKYNAFRCLRDTGFDPVRFALSQGSVSADVERGLLEYSGQERRWPSAAGVGILPFGEESLDLEAVSPPMMLTRKFQFAAYAAIFWPLLSGAELLLWSFRKRRAG